MLYVFGDYVKRQSALLAISGFYVDFGTFKVFDLPGDILAQAIIERAKAEYECECN